MYIEKLNIHNIRVLKKLSFEPCKRINFLTGSNGSGKTSILESIYLLARSKSFRTAKASTLITESKNELIVSAAIANAKGAHIQLGLKKTINSTEVHISGIKQTRVSDQARLLPLGIITPNTQKLIEGGPLNRRKFLNWGVFHVKHDYASLIASYNKILLQRNIALKKNDNSHKAWDLQFIKYANKITHQRKKYFDELKTVFDNEVEGYSDLYGIDLIFKQGWDPNKDLNEIIKSRNGIDDSYTNFGPHRADITIKYDSKLASQILSRGQQKILATLLIISKLQLIKQITNEAPILLFDDIQSEIDLEKKEQLLISISNLNCQCFITSIDTQKNNVKDLMKVFHVEQGSIC